MLSVVAKLLRLLALGLLLNFGAHASSYIGLELGSSDIGPDTGGSNYTLTDDTDLARTIFVGYRLTDNISLELGYADLGEATIRNNNQTSSKISYEQLTLGGIYGVNVTENITLFAGLGVRDTDISTNNNDVDVDDDIEFYWNIGSSFAINDTFAIRLNYSEYSDDASNIGLGLVINFGK